MLSTHLDDRVQLTKAFAQFQRRSASLSGAAAGVDAGHVHSGADDAGIQVDHATGSNGGVAGADHAKHEISSRDKGRVDEGGRQKSWSVSQWGCVRLRIYGDYTIFESNVLVLDLRS